MVDGVCAHCGAKLLPEARACSTCGKATPVSKRPDPDDTMRGRVLGERYFIVEFFGEGSMGRVYAARDLHEDREIAVKILHRHLAQEGNVAQRFMQEAKTASLFAHPHSIEIFDYGCDRDGTLYIAMELVDGEDLQTIIDHDSPLTPARIARIMSQTLSAIEAAHRAGIIHRDLKPENVLIDERDAQEWVRVCDFGIAKIQDGEVESALTLRGFVCGTPEYIAPEQARGEALDARADVYAAGCMLYQLLSAEVPFRADTALGIITQHLTSDPVPPRDRKPDWNVPRALDAIAMRAMAKDREERFASADEMRNAIEQATEALGGLALVPLGSWGDADPTRGMFRRPRRSEPPSTKRPRSKAKMIALAIAVGAIVAITLTLA